LILNYIQLYSIIMKVRIQWQTLDTGVKGHGDWFNISEQEMLESNIKSMNTKYSGQIRHWLDVKE